jgi:hypothetical protein
MLAAHKINSVLRIRNTLMRIRIPLFTLMRIRITLFTLMRIWVRLITLMGIRIGTHQYGAKLRTLVYSFCEGRGTKSKKMDSAGHKIQLVIV